MTETQQRSCKCGALYSRSETVAPSPQRGRFDCAICGRTLESWTSTVVPSYRLLAGPVRQT
jgi:hypothetical protein